MRNVPRCTVIGAAIAAIVMPSTAQGPPSPVLRYEMDVSTKSGFGAGMRGMAGAMSMMMDGGGGGDGVEHSVALVLGSTRTVSGTPRADHFFLPAVRLGKSVPLTGTRGGTSEPDSLPAA